MSRTPRTALAALAALVLSTATATSAAARPWPGDPVPETLPTAEVIDTAAAGTPLWLLLLVAVVTALVVGSAGYVAGSRRRGPSEKRDEPSLEVSEAALA